MGEGGEGVENPPSPTPSLVGGGIAVRRVLLLRQALYLAWYRAGKDLRKVAKPQPKDGYREE